MTTVRHGEACEVILRHNGEKDGTQGEDDNSQAEGEDAMQHSIAEHGTPATGAGAGRVQVQTRRNLKKRSQWRRVTELIDRKMFIEDSFFYLLRVGSIVTQENNNKSRSAKSCTSQMNAGQQDGIQEEVQVTAEPQQTSREQSEHHRALEIETFGTLTRMTTTSNTG